MGGDQLMIQVPTEQPSKIDAPPQQLIDHNKLFVIYETGAKRFKQSFNKAIIDDMKKLRYPISNVGIEVLSKDHVQVQGTPFPPSSIYVQERDLACKTTQIEMSQGMFRALALTIQLNYWAFSKTPVCLLIDDIGEGLDFQRASSLISLLVHKTIVNKFQLIMTTNDRFVMNSVPLKYWRVLQRTGNDVRVIDQHSSPKAFADFERLGLSNFDFFSRELYKRSSKR
jgi:hypothetical protein